MAHQSSRGLLALVTYLSFGITGCQLFGENKKPAHQLAEIVNALPDIDLGTQPAFSFTGVVPAVTRKYEGVSNLLISNKSFSNTKGDDLYLSNCKNIIITNCYFGLAPANMGVHMYNCTNVTINNCFFANTGMGVNLSVCNAPIKISNNQFLNINGSMFAPHAIILDKCNGPGILIDHNIVESFWGYSNINDQINLYKSNGTASSPIVVSNNIMRGGSPSNSATGIIAGDGGNSSYQDIKNNTIVNTRYVGIEVVSGEHINVMNNQLYQVRNNISNGGIPVWNQYVSTCNTILVSGNKINWINAKGDSNPLWDGSGTANPKGGPACSQVTFANNTTGQSLASMNVPAYLFTVPVDTLWHIIKTGRPYCRDINVPLPTADAGSAQNIVTASTALDGSKSLSSNGLNYTWTQVRGPNTAIISNPNTVSPGISGMTNGSYRFRLVVGDNGNGYGTDTAYDAAWVDVQVSGLPAANGTAAVLSITAGSKNRKPVSTEQPYPLTALVPHNVYSFPRF